jgi:ligand-binding SRPBCC domain-containing protein
MKIVLRSRVNCRFEEVSENFGRQLFEFLLPPKLIARLIRYDGSRPGSIVHIRFHLPYPSDWISIIKSEENNNNKYIFVDEGEKLPFGLKQWKHIHSVLKIDDNTTEIIDDMTFSTGLKLLDMLAYPVLFFAFYPRKKQYKQFFER